MPEPTMPGDIQTPVQPTPVTPVTQPVMQQPAVQTPPPVAPVVAPVIQPVDAGGNSRTAEQFDKLINSNQRLFEANELLTQELLKRNETNQVFQPIQKPITPVQPSQPVNPNDFVEVDPVTGDRYLNEGKLQNAIKAQNEETARLRQTVTEYIQNAEQKEIAKQEQEAYQAHPELNPASSQFDAQLSDFTRAVIYDSLINNYRYGGKGLSFKEAGDLVKSRMATGQPNKTMGQAVAENAGVQPVVVDNTNQEAKEQGSLAARGQTQPVPPTASDYNIDELREVTRKGGYDSDRAIALRLTNIDHTRSASDEA